MNSRERVWAALRCEIPDRVLCVGIDAGPALEMRLAPWPEEPPPALGATPRPHTAVAYQTASNAAPCFAPDVLRCLVSPCRRRVAERITFPWTMRRDCTLAPLVDDILELDISGLHPIEKDAMDTRVFERQCGGRVRVPRNLNVNTRIIGMPDNVENG